MPTQPPPVIDLSELRALAEAATPGPWCATKGCGAQVGVGVCIRDTPGSVTIKRGGFFLLEIEPNSYAMRDGDDERDEDELEDQAHADAKLIAAMRNSFEALLQEVEKLRATAADANSYRVLRTLVEHDPILSRRFREVLAMSERELAKRMKEQASNG